MEVYFHNYNMNNTDILNAVNGFDENNKHKCVVGMFVENYIPGEKEPVLLDEYYVEKPAVNLVEFEDDEGDEFYNLEFIYKSRRNEDLRLQWQFLDSYVERLMEAANKEEPLPVLNISLVPLQHDGEVSILANTVMPDSINKIEYAGDKVCSIQMAFLKRNVFFLTHDQELIDRVEIEEEASKEIDAELDEEYGDINLN